MSPIKNIHNKKICDLVRAVILCFCVSSTKGYTQTTTNAGLDPAKTTLEKVQKCLNFSEKKTPHFSSIGLDEIKIFDDKPKKSTPPYAAGQCKTGLIVVAPIYYTHNENRYPSHKQLIEILQKQCEENSTHLSGSYIPPE